MIWQDVLGLPVIGTNEDFFAAGGKEIKEKKNILCPKCKSESICKKTNKIDIPKAISFFFLFVFRLVAILFIEHTILFLLMLCFLLVLSSTTLFNV